MVPIGPFTDQDNWSRKVKSEKSIYVLGLIFGTLAIGFAAIWVKLSPLGSLGTAFWRLFIAFSFTLIFGVFFDQKNLKKIFYKENRMWFWLTVLAGIAFAADLAVWHLAIHHTSVALATLFANFAPFFMLIGSIVLLGERLHKKAVMGIMFCGWGILALSQKSSPDTSAHWSGNVLALGAAFFYALYLLILRKTKPKGPMAFYAMGIASFAGAIILLPFTLIYEGSTWWPSQIYAWGILLLLGLTSQVLGQGLITKCLPLISGELSSAILCLQSVFAAGAGYLILKEKVSFGRPWEDSAF